MPCSKIERSARKRGLLQKSFCSSPQRVKKASQSLTPAGGKGILRQHRTIASASLRRLFAPLLQFEKREIHIVFLRFPNFELGQKSCLRLLAELRGAALIIFCRGVYLTENTYQAASVRFVRCKRTKRARGRLQSFCQKRAKPFFDSLGGCCKIHFAAAPSSILPRFP